MASSDLAIRTSGLTRSFGTLVAVDSLTIEVARATVFGFLGPNGAGKTTTINMLLGLLEPTTGSAEVLGFDIRTQAQEVRAHAGALLENTGLYEQMRAEDNLEFAGRYWKMPAATRRTRIRELLEAMGLWERRREPVGSWSRGMQQRLALARALLAQPPIVFLDEPTAGLDVVVATAIRADLAQQCERSGTTIFLTTHNMAEAEQLCHRVAVIRQGRLLAVGSPDELRNRARTVRIDISGRNLPATDVALDLPGVVAAERRDGHVLLELEPGAATAPVVAALVGSGAEVDEVRHGVASLEEAFLKLVEEGA